MKKNYLLIPVLFFGLLIGLFLIERIQTNVFLNSSDYQVSAEISELVVDMENDQVDWDGTFIGIMPVRLTGATLLLRDSKEDINPLLVKCLIDRDKYVAAHVLLTLRNLSSYPQDSLEWNGLKVQLNAHGQASFNGNNLLELQRDWINQLK